MNVLWLSLLITSISLSMFVGIGFSEKNESIFLYENISLDENSTTINNESKIEDKKDQILNYEKSELDKLFKIMREKEEKEWREGDVLIASATTLAFFGFASFLTVQFRGKHQYRSNFLNYINIILCSIFIIQILQLFTICIIVIDKFDGWIYSIIIIITGCSLFVILINSRKIIFLQNSAGIKMTVGTEMVKQAKEKYTHKMLRNAKEANKELEKLKKNKPE